MSQLTKSEIKIRLQQIEIILDNIENQDTYIKNFIGFILDGGKSIGEVYTQKKRLILEQDYLQKKLHSLENKHKISTTDERLLSLKNKGYLSNEEYSNFILALKDGLISQKRVEEIVKNYEALNIKTNIKVDLENKELEFVRFISLLLHYCVNQSNSMIKDIYFFNNILQKELHIETKEILKEMYSLRNELSSTNVEVLISSFSNYFSIEEEKKFFTIFDKLSQENKIDEYRYRDIRLAFYKNKRCI
jgi:hypothetical protein